VGSGSLLFVKEGLKVGLADISSPLLGFSQWRFQLRRLPGEFFDLKTRDLPSESFDVVTAMDVFEHLADPVEAVEKLWNVLRPGGFLFGRFDAEPNEDRPLHVIQDFGPTFRCLREGASSRFGRTAGSGTPGLSKSDGLICASHEQTLG
jgi:SAM-dependent methyltransferase